jgi:hypothetical protein
MIRLFALGLALTLATSAQASPLISTTQRVADSGGCGARSHRGVGGTCVHNLDGAETYHPDRYWAPCDYSLPPSIPEGCGD